MSVTILKEHQPAQTSELLITKGMRKLIDPNNANVLFCDLDRKAKERFSGF
jgi:hypothetical protein